MTYIKIKEWFQKSINFPSNKIEYICIRKITEKAILIELDDLYSDIYDDLIIKKENFYYLSNYCSTYSYKVQYNGLWIPKSVILNFDILPIENNPTFSNKIRTL